MNFAHAHAAPIPETRASPSSAGTLLSTVMLLAIIVTTTYTGQTISFIMRNLLIAISNSATISSEGLIVQLLGVLIADVLIMDPHNAHLAISRFMPHASRRAPA